MVWKWPALGRAANVRLLPDQFVTAFAVAPAGQPLLGAEPGTKPDHCGSWAFVVFCAETGMAEPFEGLGI